MREHDPELELTPGASSTPTSVRVTVVSEGSAHPLLDTTREEWLTTVPHLMLREVVAFSLLVTVLAVISYLFDAPLLDIANPAQTPNPSKAPWYFLGIQELLHYYPPLIAGIVLPALAILALIVVPYFEINLARPAFLPSARVDTRLAGMWLVGLVSISVLLTSSDAGPVWPLIATTSGLLMAMSLTPVLGLDSKLGRWLATRSLPWWIFTWFIITWAVLTIIGVYFRGPGWSLTLPWRDGIYG
jgi:menaquinol-cytochrome c reductase cytochrome b/c subunit